VNVTVTDWITAALAVLAFGLSIVALAYSRRAARAAEASAQAAHRSASVAERNEARETEAAEERAVQWKLTPASMAGDAHLTNVGEATAFGVWVDIESSTGVRSHLNFAEAVHPGDRAVEGLAMGALGRDQILTVRWRTRPDGPERESRKPLYLWSR
jgi:hypothetical protein